MTLVIPEEERCTQESLVADGSSSKGKVVTGRSRSSYTQKLSQKLGQQFRQTPPYSEDETDGSMPSSSLGPSSASGAIVASSFSFTFFALSH